jgi:transcriptional regulator
MYVPKGYLPPNESWVPDLIRDNPLALLVTSDAGEPQATHLPVISDTESPAGSVLLGHLNRLNPHWASLRSGQQGLLIFQGPHGYVSPAVYETTPAAPTWNFTAVHVRGTLELIDDRDEKLRIVSETARTFESRFGQGWDSADSLSYFDSIVDGVGAFRLHVETADGMFKLSQEKPDEVRDRVTSSFRASESGLHRQLAGLMERALFMRRPHRSATAVEGGHTLIRTGTPGLGELGQ